jgi:hypothetical protein
VSLRENPWYRSTTSCASNPSPPENDLAIDAHTSSEIRVEPWHASQAGNSGAAGATVCAILADVAGGTADLNETDEDGTGRAGDGISCGADREHAGEFF